jgi:aminoglycoside phosphotransferase
LQRYQAERNRLKRGRIRFNSVARPAGLSSGRIFESNLLRGSDSITLGMTTAPAFPTCIAHLLAGCGVAQRRRGRLGTTISRICVPGGTSFYLKVASLSSTEDLYRERECLLWLRDRLCVPEVIYYAEQDGWAFLALTERPGENSCESLHSPPETVGMLARALRDIHELDPADCPLRETLEDELAKAGEMLAKGWIDSAGFQTANGGRTPEQVYEELLAAHSFTEDLTFTHGDYAMPNVLVTNGRVTSILDWGNARTGDRHRDFVVIRDSLIRNCPGDWMDTFLAAYGGKPLDPEKLRFYSLLDQFFSHFSLSALSPEWTGN